MRKLLILCVLVLSGCNCSGVKVVATHTVYTDYTPSTISVEADFDFDQHSIAANERPAKLVPRRLPPTN